MGTRRAPRRIAPVFVPLAIAFAIAGAAYGAAPAAQPGAAADVRLLAQQMEDIHPDLYATISRRRFRAAVDALALRAEDLSANELLVELMRIAALPGNRNGHGGIFPGDPQHRRTLHLYPIRLYDFADGTYVVDEVGKRRLVGARLVAIAGTPYTKVASLVRPLVPHDNESSRRGLLPHYVLTAEVLDGLGIADGIGPLELTFERAGGSTVDATLAPITVRKYVASFPDPHYGHYPSSLPRRRPAPMYLANNGRDLWLSPIAGGKAIFVGYNAVTSPTDAAARRLRNLGRRPGVKRVIVDLRLNGGGDNTTFGPLVYALRDPSINRRGRLFVLIGRATFSAAANFAAELDRSTRAIFVGEATGGGVKIYGDAVPFVLPETGLAARVPGRYWDFGKGRGDRRLAIYPDIAVPIKPADFFAGRDPVLATVLAAK